ncbi:MAG TPA: AAA family ATPase [Thermoanaerobaculia bacterium]
MTSGRVDRVLIVHPDSDVRRDIEVVLRDAHRQAIATRHAETAAAALQIANEYDPRIILIDLVHERALALSVARELRRADRLLIGLLNPLIDSSDVEAEFLRQAVRSGFGDFVPLPLSPSEISAALQSVPEGGPRKQEGRTVAFFSHQGGVGTTTLAINSALAIRAADPSLGVSLMDANVQFGSAAAHLGILPDRDLAGAVRELNHGPMFPLPAAGPDPGIALLASPIDPRAAEMITPEDAGRVVIELRRRFQNVIIDTAPTLDLLTLSVLDLSDYVVVVTEGSAPTVAGTARLLRMMSSLGFADDRVRLVVNRYRSAGDVLPPELIAQQLGRAVDHVVPFLVPVQLGTHRGMPALFERGAALFAEAVKRLARDVTKGSLRGRAA